MKFFPFNALIIFLTVASSYSCKTRTAKKDLQIAHNYTSVVVVDYSELSGCGFIIIMNDSTKFIPENLADSLKQNNLRIKIKYKITYKPNICMAGKTIDVIDVKPAH